MAFNFTAVNNELQDKANIFAPTAADPNAPPATPGNTAFASAGGSSASTPHAPAQAAAKVAPGSGSGGSYNPAAAQAAFDGAGPGNYKPATDKIGGTIADANTKLQEAANSYTAKADTTAAGYKIDDATLGKAAEGDDSSFSAVGSRLSKTQPDQFEAFKGLGADEIPTAASAVSKPSVFGDIYRPTAGSDYTTGQNSLDSMQLRRSGDFRNVAMQLGSDQQALESNNAKQQDELTDSTRTRLGTAYGDATTDARSKLNNMGETIIKTAKDQEVADEARRQGLDVKSISAAEFEKLKPQILKTLADSGLTRENDYLNDPSKFDLSSYITKNQDVDYTDFIDEKGAKNFNNINSLLGTGKSVAPTKAKADYSFDSGNAAKDIGIQLQGQRQAADRGLQSQIDGVMSGATSRASADPGDALKNAQDYVTRKYLDQNEGQSEGDLKAEQEAYRQLFNPETNWAPFYTTDGGLTASGGTPKTANDVLSPQEAAHLNDLATQMGKPATYKAGSAYNQSNYDPTYFDTKFKTAFDRIKGEVAGTSPMTTNGQDRIVNPIVAAQDEAKKQALIAATQRRLRRF